MEKLEKVSVTYTYTYPTPWVTALKTSYFSSKGVLL